VNIIIVPNLASILAFFGPRFWEFILPLLGGNMTTADE